MVRIFDRIIIGGFMGNFFVNFVDWFVPEKFKKDEDKNRVARVFVYCCIFLQPFFLVTGIKWVKESQPILLGNILLAIFLIALCMFLLKFTKSLIFSIEFLCFSLYLYMTVYNLLSGGLFSSSLYWMLALPLFCLVFSAQKSAVFWTSLVIVQVVILEKLALNGVDFNILNYNSNELAAFDGGNFIKQILAVSVVLYLIEKDRRRAQKEQAEALESQKKIAEEQEKFQQELENTTSKLKDAFEEISGQSKELNSQSVELNSSSSRISEDFQKVARESKIVSENTSEINSNFKNIASSLEESTSSLKDVLGKVENASGVAENAVSQTREAAELIDKLDESSREIEKVTELIREISEQTNLLALNATIESARAGEAGKGFAVVASEIKALSVKTREATEEINMRINVNNSTVKEVVDKNREIEEIITSISSLQDFIYKTLTSQSEIVENISEITTDSAQKTDGIASGAETLASSVSNVEKELESILELSKILANIAVSMDKMTKNI
jgi:methyl-accepting chemotaxis protein